ncbi:hypothetical protein [Saccharopolyspora spinosa]|uniref:hypothetical protein n=1 Tax=Saccharopolyspora spinosa TaxID=60894 RepID=UPI0002D274DB|nr:hypothetical protein [Saccharopolyspora spinosa]
MLTPTDRATQQDERRAQRKQGKAHDGVPGEKGQSRSGCGVGGVGQAREKPIDESLDHIRSCVANRDEWDWMFLAWLQNTDRGDEYASPGHR